ncbi:hypothetical protein FOPE_00723 [Fonsecaea pedrosoi]|nr:hypothetical protein FOPE_00723 [Fonsecaea pedrosoi]
MDGGRGWLDATDGPNVTTLRGLALSQLEKRRISSPASICLSLAILHQFLDLSLGIDLLKEGHPEHPALDYQAKQCQRSLPSDKRG